MANWREVEHWSRDQARAYQDEQLRRYVSEYLYPFSPFYRELFDRIGVKPDGIIAILQGIKSAGALQAELVLQ